MKARNFEAERIESDYMNRLKLCLSQKAEVEANEIIQNIRQFNKLCIRYQLLCQESVREYTKCAILVKNLTRPPNLATVL